MKLHDAYALSDIYYCFLSTLTKNNNENYTIMLYIITKEKRTITHPHLCTYIKNINSYIIVLNCYYYHRVKIYIFTRLCYYLLNKI